MIWPTVEDLVKKYSGEIAAIIVEPVAGNMGCVPPATGFLNLEEHLRPRKYSIDF